MFAIYAKTARYDNRDGFAGHSVRQAVPYVYETAALAQRMLPSSYDEEGESTEIVYYVADTTDPYRRPISLPAAEVQYIDDIVF